MITSQIVNIEIRECAWDYCLSMLLCRYVAFRVVGLHIYRDSHFIFTGCVDDLDFCAQLRELQDACDPDSNFFG